MASSSRDIIRTYMYNVLLTYRHDTIITTLRLKNDLGIIIILRHVVNFLFFSLSVSLGNVSAVFTYKWKGEDMARLLDDSTRRVMVKITIASHCTRPYSNINRYFFIFYLFFLLKTILRTVVRK